MIKDPTKSPLCFHYFFKQLLFQMKQDLQGKVIHFPRSADTIGEKDKLLACKPLCRSDSDGAAF